MRKRNLKAALDSLEAHNESELYLSEEIHPRVEVGKVYLLALNGAGQPTDLFPCLIAKCMKFFGLTCHITMQAYSVYDRYLDSRSDRIEEAMILFLMVLDELNSSQEKARESELSVGYIDPPGSKKMVEGWLNDMVTTVEGLTKQIEDRSVKNRAEISLQQVILSCA